MKDIAVWLLMAVTASSVTALLCALVDFVRYRLLRTWLAKRRNKRVVVRIKNRNRKDNDGSHIGHTLTGRRTR